MNTLVASASTGGSSPRSVNVARDAETETSTPVVFRTGPPTCTFTFAQSFTAAIGVRPGSALDVLTMPGVVNDASTAVRRRVPGRFGTSAIATPDAAMSGGIRPDEIVTAAAAERSG